MGKGASPRKIDLTRFVMQSRGCWWRHAASQRSSDEDICFRSRFHRPEEVRFVFDLSVPFAFAAQSFIMRGFK